MNGHLYGFVLSLKKYQTDVAFDGLLKSQGLFCTFLSLFHKCIGFVGPTRDPPVDTRGPLDEQRRVQCPSIHSIQNHFLFFFFSHLHKNHEVNSISNYFQHYYYLWNYCPLKNKLLSITSLSKCLVTLSLKVILSQYTHE